MQTYGASNQISALIGLGLYRELAPVLTALLFVGRAGSSIAAELGLMRATDQITALGLMGIDPVGKAVAPRFWRLADRAVAHRCFLRLDMPIVRACACDRTQR